MRRGLVTLTLTFLLSLTTMADNSYRHRAIPINYVNGYALIYSLYSENGDYTFDEIVFFEWNDWKGRHEVRHWYLLKNSREPYDTKELREAINERTRQRIMKENDLDEWPEEQPGQSVATPWEPEWRWPSNVSYHAREDGSSHYIINSANKTFEIVTTGKLHRGIGTDDPELLDREILPKEKRTKFQEQFDGKTIPKPSLSSGTNGPSH